MKERYKPENPDAYRFRFHVQTAGCSLTAQQPMVNIIRTAYQALEAVLGGTQSLHTNSYDEAIDLLLKGKIDVIVADFPFCALTAYRYQDKGMIAGKSPLTFEALGIAMAGDTLLINWVQNFLTILQGTGELKKMHEKWLNIGSWIDELS